MSDAWNDVADWWIDAVRDDPANSDDYLALLDEVLDDDPANQRSDRLTLDVGCGEGQVMRHLGGAIIGIDVVAPLLIRAQSAGPTVRAELPDLSWARTAAFDRAICVGVVEAVADHHTLFCELRRVTRPNGQLVVVSNHPVTTAPHAEPMVDPNGEVFWRWGDYLGSGEVRQRVGDGVVVLHHRPIGRLLGAAAAAGWRLDRLIEHGPSAATLARHPDVGGQTGIPTLVGMRWASIQ
ncbi:MAG: class I SAM-dependent methyltransferase [Actinomycetota bacterium]